MSVSEASVCEAAVSAGTKIYISETNNVRLTSWKAYFLGTPFRKNDSWYVEVIGLGKRKVYVNGKGQAFIKQEGNRIFCDQKSAREFEEDLNQKLDKQREDKRSMQFKKLQEHEREVSKYRNLLGIRQGTQVL